MKRISIILIHFSFFFLIFFPLKAQEIQRMNVYKKDSIIYENTLSITDKIYFNNIFSGRFFCHKNNSLKQIKLTDILFQKLFSEAKKNYKEL